MKAQRPMKTLRRNGFIPQLRSPASDPHRGRTVRAGSSRRGPELPYPKQVLRPQERLLEAEDLDLGTPLQLAAGLVDAPVVHGCILRDERSGVSAGVSPRDDVPDTLVERRAETQDMQPVPRR